MKIQLTQSLQNGQSESVIKSAVTTFCIVITVIHFIYLIIQNFCNFHNSLSVHQFSVNSVKENEP